MRERDEYDPLGWIHEQFFSPPGPYYFDGNSLGLISQSARLRVEQALDAWERWGVSAWTEADPPWHTYVQTVADIIAGFLGAVAGEVTLGASTTVMLHQLLATFYHPNRRRYKILLDGAAFPTDRYAVQSFLVRMGQPADAMVVVRERANRWLAPEDLVAAADDRVALAVLPSVVFTTGQLLPMDALVDEFRRRGIMIIWDLSHSAGLVPHHLHAQHIDAAVFCTYKYLNGGPGSPGGAFIHQSHWPVQPGLQGWWGSDPTRQFLMREDFMGAETAHALQLGTPSILSLAALMGSVEVLQKAGIPALYERSLELVALLEQLLTETILPLGVSLVTPPSGERGGHVTVAYPHGRALAQALRAQGVIPDFRPPDMIRLAPAPSTTRFADLPNALAIFEDILKQETWRGFTGTSTLVP